MSPPLAAVERETLLVREKRGVSIQTPLPLFSSAASQCGAVALQLLLLS